MTTGLLTERDTPDCPHCSAHMDEATVSLGDLLAHWPIPRFVDTGADGFNHDCHRYLTVDCPSCEKPSVLAIDPLQPAVTAKLIASRTAKDVDYVIDRAAHQADQAPDRAPGDVARPAGAPLAREAER